MGIFLAYAGARGDTLLDAELYLPKGWTDQPTRLQGVGLAPDTPQAATGPTAAGPGVGGRRVAGLGRGRHGPWPLGDTALLAGGLGLLAVPAHATFLVAGTSMW